MPLRLRFIRFLGVRWKMILRIPLCTEAVQVLLQAFWMQVIHAEPHAPQTQLRENLR